jgi:hypothetical protein
MTLPCGAVALPLIAHGCCLHFDKHQPHYEPEMTNHAPTTNIVLLFLPCPPISLNFIPIPIPDISAMEHCKCKTVEFTKKQVYVTSTPN